MQKHYPHLKKITPNDFLLNLINHYLNQILACHPRHWLFEWILITSEVLTDLFVTLPSKYRMTLEN